MRANHATKPQEPAPRGVAGARRGIARRLSHPRTVAAGGALLAQLWGIGAPGAYAASADPLREPARPAVHRALQGAPALDAPAHTPALGGPALDGQSAERSVGPDGDPAGGAAEGAAGAVGGALQERIRAGGLPLPGQPAAVPDAFAIASGLLGTAPAQAGPAETRVSREGEPAGLPAADRPRPGTTRSAVPRQAEATQAPPVLEAASEAVPAADRDGTTATPAGSAAPGDGGTPETLAITDTATVTAVDDGSATATAVLAPIAAGLLLTGAAMCKHRGLPRGH